MKKEKFRRLFFDIETSPNIVLSWRVGHKISIDYDNIIKEKSIICICWKYDGEPKIYSLSWDELQSDKKMLRAFIKELKKADEIVGHNSDRFDIKWVRTRALFHRLDCPPNFVSIDTLKLARRGFNFNSNRLDYIGKFLGKGGKLSTGGFKLWKSVLLENNRSSLAKMVRYCKRDVKQLEEIFNAMKTYVKHTTHIGVKQGEGVRSCPECASHNVHIHKYKVTAAGSKKVSLQCQDCGKYYTILESKL